jgi:hypothetical protein
MLLLLVVRMVHETVLHLTDLFLHMQYRVNSTLSKNVEEGVRNMSPAPPQTNCFELKYLPTQSDVHRKSRYPAIVDTFM